MHSLEFSLLLCNFQTLTRFYMYWTTSKRLCSEIKRGAPQIVGGVLRRTVATSTQIEVEIVTTITLSKNEEYHHIATAHISNVRATYERRYCLATIPRLQHGMLPLKPQLCLDLMPSVATDKQALWLPCPVLSNTL